MKSFRLTPLNLVTAAFIFLAVYIAVFGAAGVGADYARWGTAIALLFILFAVATFFLDLIFRNFFPGTKRLWLIETAFICMTVILFLILKS
ncbi:MAG: hypothetical protein INR69_19940 [Mucilaginibacter polytrichastri]|nr:hypothetical protein [Mucilaginibacter polytrichastri]